VSVWWTGGEETGQKVPHIMEHPINPRHTSTDATHDDFGDTLLVRIPNMPRSVSTRAVQKLGVTFLSCFLAMSSFNEEATPVCIAHTGARLCFGWVGGRMGY